jgi:hypothetical protein
MEVTNLEIWEVWDSEDAAMSDRFFPAKAAAIEYIRESYNLIGPEEVADTLKCPCWPIGNGNLVYLMTHKVRLTPEGICWALQNLPNR